MRWYYLHLTYESTVSVSLIRKIEATLWIPGIGKRIAGVHNVWKDYESTHWETTTSDLRL